MNTRYFSLFSEENQIELFNSMWGTETVKYNGEVVSKETTMWGTTHRFHVDESGEEIEYEVDVYFKGFRVAYDVYRNGVALLLS